MKKTIKSTLYFSLFLALVLSGCQIAGTDNTDAVRAEALEGAFLVSHIQETDKNVALSLSAKAAVPSADISDGVPLPASGVSVSDYPESGQSSVYSIVAAPGVGANVYLATVTTSYGGGWQDGVRKKTVESYYIKDIEPNATYTTADPIVNASGVADPLYRVQSYTEFKTKFLQGQPVTSTRYETILSTSSGSGYASFADASLNYNWAYVPASGSGVNWSSKVSYTQELPAEQLSLDLLISSSADTYYLDGIRYYTEVGTSSDHEASSLAIERVYEGPNQGGRLIAQIVTRCSYTRAGGLPGESSVDSKATYYLTKSLAFPVSKSGLATSVPLP